MEENQKSVQGISNMFGSKPYENPTHNSAGNFSASTEIQTKGSFGKNRMPQDDGTKQTNNFRINDYDNNILNDRAHLDIDDNVLKLEIKIADRQSMLEDLKQKVKAAEEVGNLQETLKLKLKEKNLEIELLELNQQYSQRSFSSKFTGKVSQIVEPPKKQGPDIFIKIQKFISTKILPKISKRFDSISFLGESLDTLSNINKNIDELIAMKGVPYGENKENYEKLTAYLNHANKLHSQISKSMESMK